MRTPKAHIMYEDMEAKVSIQEIKSLIPLNFTLAVKMLMEGEKISYGEDDIF